MTTTVTGITAAKAAADLAEAKAYADDLFAAVGDGSVVQLTDQATVAINIDLGKKFKLSLGGSRTLANPSGTPEIMQQFLIRIRTVTSNCALVYGNKYRFPPEFSTSFAISASSGKVAYLGFIYNDVDDLYDCVAWGNLN